jgi:hypothetical protein
MAVCRYAAPQCKKIVFLVNVEQLKFINDELFLSTFVRSYFPRAHFCSGINRKSKIQIYSPLTPPIPNLFFTKNATRAGKICNFALLSVVLRTSGAGQKYNFTASKNQRNTTKIVTLLDGDLFCFHSLA